MCHLHKCYTMISLSSFLMQTLFNSVIRMMGFLLRINFCPSDLEYCAIDLRSHLFRVVIDMKKLLLVKTERIAEVGRKRKTVKQENEFKILHM